MLKVSTRKFIEVGDWDDLVSETYGKPYSFQQQAGCQARGVVNLQIPSSYTNDYKNDSLPEVVNGRKMGVSFKAWLERDPKEPLKDDKNNPRSVDMFWERNFYPDLHTIANDLYKKGLIEPGEYSINIDW